ncbi:MAG: hypothetical protein Q4G48_08520 [Bacteroidia bacterium]|nr:hypothetical protein [Bacteroidia bacterium]
MNTKAVIWVIFILSSLAANAQDGDRDIDLRAGLGFFKLKEGNAFLAPIEIELNAKLSDYFAIAP